jgi:hypothetical protein
MAKFEAHITCPREQADAVRAIGALEGWTFSQIDGDPIMGAGVKCYLSAYSTHAVRLLAEMRDVERSLALAGLTVLRTKVEQILFDSKTGVDEITNLG